MIQMRIDVPKHPADKEIKMDAYKGKAAHESRDGVTGPLRASTSGKELLLVLGNEIDLFLDVTL